jgi:agarase
MLIKHKYPLKTLALVCLLSGALIGCSQQADSEIDTSKLVQTQLTKVSQYENIMMLADFNQKQLPIKVEESGATYHHQLSGDEGALVIDFSADAYRSAIVLKPKEPWDLSQHDEVHLAFDAKNVGEQSAQLYLSISDVPESELLAGNAAGTRTSAANYTTNIAVGESGTYFVILKGKFFDTEAGIREKPAPWETTDEMLYWRFGKSIDLSKITEVSFVVRGNISDKKVQVDNLRLRKNPSYKLEYLANVSDEFGQNAKENFPTKVHSLEELQDVAKKELTQLAAEGKMVDRSRFGGWKSGPKLDATGYFRTQKVEDKWWMVDPEGYLFFSHGVANVRMANTTTLTGIDFKDDSVRYVDPNEVTPEDSIGIVKVSDDVMKTRYVSSELRNNMFNWLPDYDDPLAEHYSYRRSVHKGPIKSGETFSFYRANLERRYGETEEKSYIKKWEDVTLARMENWGFTSFGNWVDPAFYPNERVPYFANGWIIGDYKTLASDHDHWAPLPDPYDPEFVKRAKITIDVIAQEIKGSPWCAGVFVDNEKSWGIPDGTVDERYGVILKTLTLNAENSPAKKAFIDYLQNKYSTIASLSKAWQRDDVTSWNDISRGIHITEYSESFVADVSTMLEMLSEEYFKVVHNTLENVLPNHLYMGARMANFGMPQETIKASVKYSDVLSFNIYEEGVQPKEWSFLNEIDLPTVIGEFHIGATNETGLFHPGLVQADDQKDRATMYKAYMESVAAHKNMVGAHWFQYLDSPLTGRTYDGEPYNVGFVSTTDIPYPDMVKAAKEFNGSLYSKRYNNKYK